ncbi:MAG TPA: D-alanyl-D-alanine carboxypeptidase family protein [Leucothrix sp.]|nr:D-alanyl-D-alanine carboxypeptidase family protein [Leucothrix sp.]
MSVLQKVSGFVLSGLIVVIAFSSLLMPAKTVAKQPKLIDRHQAEQDVENYLMGKFIPAKHEAFVRVPKKYANRSGYYLRKEALNAYIQMHKAARKDGVKLIIRSATRNFNYQKGIWERKWRKQKRSRSAKNKALNILRLSSMPGTSRHHWGTEVDLNAFNNKWFESGDGLKLFNWLNKNASKYGFQRPYTKKDSKRPTGYNEEKWHWSFTPLSIPMIRDARLALDDTKIMGFSGSDTAKSIGVVKKYILGISKSCQ